MRKGAVTPPPTASTYLLAIRGDLVFRHILQNHIDVDIETPAARILVY